MAPETTAAKKFVGLPLSIVSPVDVGRLMRELEAIDNRIMQHELQKLEAKLPKTSKLMDELIELNHVDLLDKAERSRLEAFLVAVRKKAPVIHISFSSDPSPIFTAKLMNWLRVNVHPLLLLTVGLQPNIGAGCMVRTTNKYFDFSLFDHFSKNRDLLMGMLRELPDATETVQKAPVESAASPDADAAAIANELVAAAAAESQPSGVAS